MVKNGWSFWRGTELSAIIEAGSRKAVQDTSYAVLNASQREVPHDEGTLQRSGRVDMKPGTEATGCVSYGGGAGTGMPRIPYAVRWHENSAAFQKGRKHRYLADPLNRHGPVTLVRELENMLRRLGR